MNIVDVFNYYKHCVELIDSQYEFIKNLHMAESDLFSFFFCGVYFIDNDVNRTKELESTILIPIDAGSRVLFDGYLGDVSKTTSKFSIDEILNYLKDSKNLLMEKIYKKELLEKSEDIPHKNNTPLKKFARKELKTLCEKLADEYGLIKDSELSKEKISLIVNGLESMGYEVNPKSVATVLRDKLDYKKKKY